MIGDADNGETIARLLGAEHVSTFPLREPRKGAAAFLAPRAMSPSSAVSTSDGTPATSLELFTQ